MPEGAHLQVHTTGRGFAHMPAIPSTYGGDARVYESSNAEGPHLWLKVHESMPGAAEAEAFAHLTVEDAVRLAEQLLYLAEHHYQNS